MGSVIDYIDCPNCKQEAFSDYYWKTGEEYVNCQSCGYHYSQVIVNRGKPMSEMTKDDWEIKEIKNPYGAFMFKQNDSIGTRHGSLENEKEYDEFVSEMISLQNEIESCVVSRFVNNEIKKEVII